MFYRSDCADVPFRETSAYFPTMTEAINKDSPFLKNRAPVPLRVTCYGSSSSKTPAKYLREARQLGYTLARRGHTCVNGAGSYGCMAAMNDGAVEGNGNIVGVIHKMWLAQAEDSVRKLRDGGAHGVFTAGKNGTKTEAPIREMIVVGGKDLQNRKRFLVEGADALVVMPGGPGTWDELWEMACVRKLELENALPIVCVNVDNFYQPFIDMLKRGYEDKLMEQKPEEVVHFVDTAEEAVKWIEANVRQPKLYQQRQNSTISKLRNLVETEDGVISPLILLALGAIAGHLVSRSLK